MIMRLLRPRRMLFLGVGFLLGSRAGRAPWEKAVAVAGQVQNKAQAKLGGGDMYATSANGLSTDLRDTEGAIPEM